MIVFKRFIVLGLLAITIVSCAVHRGSMSASTDLKIVKYVDFAFGSAKAKHVFGIGGLHHDALVFEAKLNLMKNFPLKVGEYYANYIVDFKESFFIFSHTTLVTITADIVKTLTDNSESPFSDIVKQKLILTKKNKFFCIGDTVVDRENYRYIVSTDNSIDKITVWPIDGNAKNFQFSKLSKFNNEMFSTKKTLGKYKPGVVVFDDGFNYNVIGVNQSFVLLSNVGNGSYTVIHPIPEKK